MGNGQGGGVRIWGSLRECWAGEECDVSDKTLVKLVAAAVMLLVVAVICGSCALLLKADGGDDELEPRAWLPMVKVEEPMPTCVRPTPGCTPTVTPTVGRPTPVPGE